MLKNPLFRLVLACLIVSVAMLSTAARAETTIVKHTSAVVKTHPSQGTVREIKGAQAEVFTTAEGVTMNFRTDELEPGHVYTAWLAIFNAPEKCAAASCTGDDIIKNTAAVKGEITYADGILTTKDGKMSFAGFVAAGKVAKAWFGNGLTNPMGAQFLIVINDHGLFIPDLAASMLNSYRGGCTDKSLPAAFPDTAKADGTPGPNTCKLIQVAALQQLP